MKRFFQPVPKDGSPSKKRLAAAAEPCDGTSPAGAGAGGDGEGRPAEEPRKFLTWNANSLLLRMKSDWPAFSQLVARIDPDVICVQEVRMLAAGSKGAPKNPSELKDDTSSSRDEKQAAASRMEGETSAKRRKLEHHHGLSDAPGFSSFHMEDLPEEIQPLVLSLLSLKEAARTSIVSRKWRMIWTRHPNLCFDGTKKRPNYEDCVKIERAKFIETVNSVVQQRSGIGLNKFIVRCSLSKNSSSHLDMWIHFAAAAKAKIIDINLWTKRYIGGSINERYLFPLESLDIQDGPFIQALFLTDISIKPHLDMRGFPKLRRLRLDRVHIAGDLPGLLLNCYILEDLELIVCSGVTDLNIPHKLDKLKHLLVSHMGIIQMVDFHVTGLAHFEYKGGVIPIQLHGCSKLEKATITFKQDNKTLGHAFTAIPSISAVKELNMHADIEAYRPVWVSQGHMVTARPTFMFSNLRHLSCEIQIFTNGPNKHSGLLQLAHYLSFAPQLETLQLHMLYETCRRFTWEGEVTGEEAASCMHRLDHLKTVYMSGFRCYWPQVELLCGILAKSPALEHVTLQPRVTLDCPRSLNMFILEYEICKWARSASERFGKPITVVRRTFP